MANWIKILLKSFLISLWTMTLKGFETRKLTSSDLTNATNKEINAMIISTLQDVFKKSLVRETNSFTNPSNFDPSLLKAEGRQSGSLVFQPNQPIFPPFTSFPPGFNPGPPQSFRTENQPLPAPVFVDFNQPIQFPGTSRPPVPSFAPPFFQPIPQFSSPNIQTFQPQQIFSQANPSALGLSQTAQFTERLTQNIANRFQLTREEIATVLPQVNLNGTLMERICPDFREPSLPPCAFERYRRFEGDCNNIQFTKVGRAEHPYRRFLRPSYADGIMLPRLARNNAPLPNARLISTTVLVDADNSNRDITYLAMQFGQFLDHDLLHTAGGVASQCCNNRNDPACMPIDVPPNDNFYGPLRISCLEFVRSLPVPREQCQLGPREQLNQLTSFIDCSNVYGNNRQRADSLRTFQGGRLRTTPMSPGFKDLLPKEGPQSQSCVERTDLCFMAGDTRVNLQPTLTVLHTIWMREHNRCADILQRLNPHWNDETVFQEARAIVIAEMQKVVYDEYLPIIMGEFVSKYDIKTLKNGHYWKYKVFIDPTITAEFATCAYRFGHSMIQPFLENDDQNNNPTGKRVLLSDQFFMPFMLYTPNEADNFLRGLLNHQSQTVDNFFTDEVRNKLFKRPREGFGLDLPALNIQRERDHGIPGYNDFRVFSGMKRARTFEEFADVINPENIERLKRVYSHPDDVDCYVGGILERHVPGGLIGITFAHVIGLQFAFLKQGDRFWYENVPTNTSVFSGFSEDKLAQIRNTKMSRIICDNSDSIKSIQGDPFRIPSASNPRVRCESLPMVNLSPWQERPQG